MTVEASTRSADAGWWVLFATILASSMAFIDGTALNVAMPALQASLRASGASLLWIINGYALMLASGTMGGLFGLQRRATGGIQAPVLTHLTWSTLMLRFLPALVDDPPAVR